MILVLLLALAGKATGQQINSTYSRFGIGVLPAQANAKSLGMGGLHAPLADATGINPYNPASYSFLEVTTLQVTGEAVMMKASTATESLRTNNGLIGEMSMAWRKAGSKWGSAVGLHPYSRVGYVLSNTAPINDSVNATYTYRGIGGLNEAFLGASRAFNMKQQRIQLNDAGKSDTIHLAHTLSMGLNLNYLFGSTTQVSIADIDNGQYLNSRLNKTTFTQGFLVQAGMIYIMPLSARYEGKKIESSKQLQFGATYKIGRDIRAKETLQGDSYVIESTSFDTAFSSISAKYQTAIPHAITAGIAYRIYNIKKGSLLIGLQYHAQNWSNYRIKKDGLETSVIGLDNMMSIGLGIDYRPMGSGKDGLLNQMQYRLGANWQDTHLRLNDQNIMRSSYSAGMSVPLLKSDSRMHLSVEYSKMGTTANNLIQENQTTIWLGFSLAPLRSKERWFHTYQYD